ncbi:MAG TPA: FKBP-type peptidyl-prolyl cis-trans isomerase [Rubricoccaceae bacterium]|jgi:FKBP-type peptidyl-prolyl cis-trans isomerase FkpA/FKBP-type peptidyl-prolyl cis-trans isomerase FklB
MTSRFLVLAFAAAALSLTGCKGGGAGTSDTANLDSLATGDPTDLLAYNAGFETGGQLLEQDSTFSYERFKDGFEAGLRGDSTEIAYALGLRAGLGLRADTVSNIDPSLFLTGLRSGLNRDSSRVSAAQVQRATALYQDSLAIRQLRAQAATNPAAQAQLGAVRANGASAARFLAGVERRQGVRKTASGMLYTITTPGRGASPTDADQVAIRYVGKLADGFEFDRSPGTDPVTLPVGAVVPGFAEALKAMKVGETRTVWLPPNLAYGLQGAPGPEGQGGIPPNSALEFQITLVEIVQTPAGPPAGMMPQGAPAGAQPGQ